MKDGNSLAAVLMACAFVPAPVVAVRPLQADTIAYWRFENGSADTVATGSDSILDSSGHSFHGTPVNGPVYRASVKDNPITATSVSNALSLDFDGTNDHVFIPDNPLFELTGSLTLEAYIKVRSSDPGSPGQIIFRGDTRFALDPYWLRAEAGEIAFLVSGAHQDAKLHATIPSYNEWMHVAGSLNDATGAMRLYFNGDLVASMDTSARPFAHLDATKQPGLGIGALQVSGQEFDGLIDEVRISDRALGPSEFLPGPATLCLLALGGLAVVRRRRM